jgi:pentatricopeptide repeat protein
MLSLRRCLWPASHPSSALLLHALSEDADLTPTLNGFFCAPPPPMLSSSTTSTRPSHSLLTWPCMLPDRAFPLDTIFFYIALKSRHTLDMLDAGVTLDNITYATLITAARWCCQFSKAIEWFERMHAADGVLPDEVTYSAMLDDVYTQLGMKEEVLAVRNKPVTHPLAWSRWVRDRCVRRVCA